MALLKCKECGGQVSSDAKACPSCGAKPPKKTSALTWLIGGIVLIGIFKGISTESSRVDAAKASETPEQIAAAKKRNAQIALAVAATQATKNGMKDPESFDLKSLVVQDDGTGCLTFRARNSFNAMLQTNAVFVPGDKPKLLIDSQDGNKFVNEWNKRCTKAGGSDVTDFTKRRI